MAKEVLNLTLELSNRESHIQGCQKSWAGTVLEVDTSDKLIYRQCGISVY